MKRLLLAVLAAVTLAAPVALDAQAPAEPLESFVVQVARLWAAGDASALVRLAPSDGRMALDVGESVGTVHGRHVAAALRALFADRETASIRPTRATVAGGQPLRGFGELSWTSRSRGMSDTQTVTLYLGTVWEESGWRIRELRIHR